MADIIFRADQGAGVRKIIRIMQGDTRTHVVRFVVPRYESGVDIAPLAWYICFIDANGKPDIALPDELHEITEDEIRVRWTIDGRYTAVAGSAQFELRGVAAGADGAALWRSGIGELEIAEGLDYELPEDMQNRVSALDELIIHVQGDLEGVYAARDAAGEAAQLANNAANTAYASAAAAEVSKEAAAAAANNAHTATASANAAAASATQAATDANKAAQEYAELDGKVEQLSEEIESITNTVLEYKTVDSLGQKTGYRAAYNPTYNRIAFSSVSNYNCAVYPVTAGESYRIYGHGYDTVSGCMAVVGDADIISNGTAYCNLLQVINVGNATDYTYHTVEVTVERDGYLYVNYRSTAAVVEHIAEAKVLDVDKAIQTFAGYKGVIKSGEIYTFVARAYADVYVAYEFKHYNGGNGLLQWHALRYGSFDGQIFHSNKTVFDAYTDIVGPVSIAPNRSASGRWSGGVHTVTVDGAAYPTAREKSLSVYVDGVEITNANDGFYSGHATIVAENELFFPHTISGSDLSTATLAVTETRTYKLADTLKLEVTLDLESDCHIFAYYGMQFQSAAMTRYLLPDVGARYAKTDIAEMVAFDEPSNRYIMYDDDGWELTMMLDRAGIGDYRYNDGTDSYGHVMKSGQKIYFQPIYNTGFSAGKTLYWSGEYAVRHY